MPVANYAVTAYKGKGITKAQNTAQREFIKPDLMYKYHFRSSSTAANNHIEGFLYVNKAMNTSTGLASNDTLSVTIVDGT
jgi:hypothetical protein